MTRRGHGCGELQVIEDQPGRADGNGGAHAEVARAWLNNFSD